MVWKLFGLVDDVDVDEACVTHQLEGLVLGSDGPRSGSVRASAVAGFEIGAVWMVWNAMRPPGRMSVRGALSTESFGRSQQSTSVCTMASNERGLKGRARALALTHQARESRRWRPARQRPDRIHEHGRRLRVRVGATRNLDH